MRGTGTIYTKTTRRRYFEPNYNVR